MSKKVYVLMFGYYDCQNIVGVFEKEEEVKSWMQAMELYESDNIGMDDYRGGFYYQEIELNPTLNEEKLKEYYIGIN